MHLGGEIADLNSDASLRHALHLPPHHRDALLKATHQVVSRARIPCGRDLHLRTHLPDA